VRLVVKVLLVLLFVAVLPVAVSGTTSVLAARRAVAEAAATTLDAEARHLAELAETTILGSLDDLKQASLLGLSSLSPAERPGALWLIYRADASRTAVVLLDGKTRESVADPVYQTTISDQPGLADHEAFPATALSRFATHVPLDEALAAGKAVSVPYADPERGAPFIVLAVKVPGPMKDGVEQPWVVAVELSLRRLNERFAEASDEGLTAFLTDLDGRVVCHTQAQEAMSRSDLAGNPGVQALFSTASPASGVVNLEDPEAASLIAYARLSRLASAQGRTWGVVVERDRDAALAGLSSVLRQVVFWVAAALVLAILAGIVLARGVVEPVEILTRVVGRFASDDDKRGQVRAPALGSDEIGRLATAFNTMADQIESRDRQLRAFNDELQHKVDERTAELKEAQSQLIESQKMAAVGELGAGVAHEINNPLAAVLGSAQLALLRADKADTRVRPHLEDIEKEALRIKDIVENLLKLSQDKSQQVMGTVDVNSVVDGAVALVARPLISARIAVKKELAPNLPKIRGRAGELQQAVMQLLTNAKDAMPEGGTLTIKTDVLDGKLVRLTIEDTGQGLNPAHKERAFEPFFTTRADKGHKGMGLAVVQRIVQDHQGRVVLDSAGLGKGCTARLSFPATRDARQLV
jgi:two-component system NtrC family sensor kinase